MAAAVKDILRLVDETAPFSGAEPWDNVGLLLGSEKAEVRMAWVALEVTSSLAELAEENRIDLILTHHPLIFHPLKRITEEEFPGSAILRLAKAGISVISAHTNLDAAAEGVNDCLALRLGLQEIGPLPGFACGRTGFLPRAMGISEATALIRDRLGTGWLRTAGPTKTACRRIAVASGAGGEAVEKAAEWGADLLLTGEVKYHEALTAKEYSLFLVEAGHDKTEEVVLEPWTRRLQRRADELQLSICFAQAPVLTTPYSDL